MDVDRESLIRAVVGEGRGELDLSGATVESGWESVVLDSGDGWIYRFPRPHVAFERELALLERLRNRLPAPIPVVEWTGQRTTFAAYRKLEGQRFDAAAYADAQAGQREILAASLAAFLVAMHSALTTADIAELGIPAPGDPFEPIATIRSRISDMPTRVQAGVGDVLDEAEAHARRSDGDEPVVTHNDFDFSNLVLDGPVGRVAGVWDFSCVQLGSRSSDLRYLAGRSADLVARVGAHYESLCGKPIDLRAAVLADRIERIDDSLDAGPDALEHLVAGWEPR
jgi:aminoglycoside phosphotransferase (APT) family kinase protein